MPLHTVYRPRNFEEFVGNKDLLFSLESVLSREEDVPHSYLFSGPSGAGKTTLAYILQSELNCDDTDFHMYNSANTRGIDTIRKIGENCKFAPNVGDKKIYLMDEAHGITGAGAEALLLLLEEPPPHVYFILCTSKPEKLDIALKRRCHHYEVKPLMKAQTIKLLNSILEKEEIEGFSEDVIERIASTCNGSAGIALNLLDTVIDITDNKDALNAINNTTVSESDVAEIARALLQQEQWVGIAKKIKGLSGDPESLRRAFLGYFSAVLLGNTSPKMVSAIMLALSDNTLTMHSGKAGLTLALYLAYAETDDIPF